MLKRFRRYLLLLNAGVFLSILAVFSGAVYWSVCTNLDKDEHQRLQVLTDTLVSSIEPEDKDEVDPSIAVPDVLETYGAKENIPAGRVSVEWFDAKLKKKADKGTLKITAPFIPREDFQEQQQPHALVLTRSVHPVGLLMGYVRIAVSLQDSDGYKNKLLAGLISGTLLSLLAGCMAIAWLVEQSLKPMEASIQKLSQFGADASHELKSPLMAIKTNATVALKYASEMRPKDKEKFELILNAADQMVATTSGLLRLAGAEHKLEQSQLVKIEVHPLLIEIVDELTPSIQSRKVTVAIDKKDLELDLLGRKEDIKIAVKNVIENAIRYSKQNGSVWVKAVREGTRVKIEIADDGIGISETELPKVFDRFWRSDKARKHTDGGSGLGLSIVESIVKRYRGTVGVKSRLGEGTTFTIFLPSA